MRGIVGFDLGRGRGFGFGLGPGEQRVVGSGRACVVGDGGGHGDQEQQGDVVVVREGPPLGRAAAEYRRQVTFPSVGTTILVVQHSSLGYVLAEANGQVLYTYAKDTKNGAPTCTGSCAAAWPPATGTPQAGPADHFPATFALVKGAGGVGQITYNGYPLYLFKGAKPLSTAGNGIGGVWHVVPLSASDISGG